LQKSCFIKEARHDKLAFATQPELSSHGTSIITAHINLDISWLKDDNWEIDRIFKLVNSKALYKEFGPELLNRADPTTDFRSAKKFLKQLPTMEMTFVQRRLFQVIAKTCRLLLITAFYESCSKVLKIMLQEEKKLNEMVFEVVVTLIGSTSKLLGELGIRLWELFVKTVTGDHLEQLLDTLSSIYCPKGESDDEKEDSDSSTTSTDDEIEVKNPDTWKDEESDNSETSNEHQSKAVKLAPSEKVELVENKDDVAWLLKPARGEKKKAEDEGKEFDEETDMMRKIVFSVLKNKQANREREIKRAMLPNIILLLEIFAKNCFTDPLIWKIVFPLVECYAKDHFTYSLV